MNTFEVIKLILEFVVVLGGLGGFVSIFLFFKQDKQKKQAEADGQQQDVYQEIISDLREDRKILKAERDDYIKELKDWQLKHNSLEDTVTKIQHEIKLLKSRHAKEQCLRFDCKERLFG